MINTVSYKNVIRDKRLNTKLVLKASFRKISAEKKNLTTVT